MLSSPVREPLLFTLNVNGLDIVVARIATQNDWCSASLEKEKSLFGFDFAHSYKETGLPDQPQRSVSSIFT